MQCPETLRVQAYVDGEVDALGSADIERHLGHCAECRELRAQVEELRAQLRPLAGREPAPDALRQRALQLLDEEDEGRVAQGRRTRPRFAAWSFWSGVGSGLAAAGVAAVCALYALSPAPPNHTVDEILGAHVSALMSGHIVAVESTDHHTVKPWFAGRTEVSPVVVDFAAEGYALRGGRVDTLDQQRAAVLIYQHGRHVIDVYCWAAPAGALPKNVTRRGYHLAFWKSGDLAYAAVSDTAWSELLGLRELVQSQRSNDPP